MVQKREILVEMVIRVTLGHSKFRISVCIIWEHLKKKYFDIMAGLRDETISKERGHCFDRRPPKSLMASRLSDCQETLLAVNGVPPGRGRLWTNWTVSSFLSIGPDTTTLLEH